MNVNKVLTYSYRLDGNRISEEDTVNNLTRTYTYDNIGRLTGESISGDTNLNMTYAYDMRGNRTSKAVTGDENYTVSSTYDNNNRLTKQTKSVAGMQTEGVQYYYDNNGNQTFKQRFGYSTGTMMSASLSSYSHDIESFTYNAKNQLTGYTKGSTTASYTYGVNGLRKSKTVGSTVTGFIWNGQNLAAETNGSTVKNIYSYGPDGIQCGKINGSDIFYVKDAHGNTVTTLNGSKGSIRDYTYDAFGNQLSTITSSDTNPFRYCGEYYDNESGNIYLRARYYDSSIGRFISEDPVKDGLNWYSYCSSNPVSFSDPLGLADDPDDGVKSLNWMISRLMKLIDAKAQYKSDPESASITANEIRQEINEVLTNDNNSANIASINSYSAELKTIVEDVVINGTGDLQGVSAVLAIYVELRDDIVNAKRVRPGDEIIPENRVRNKYTYYLKTGDIFLADVNPWIGDTDIDEVRRKIIPNSDHSEPTDTYTGISMWNYWVKVVYYDKYRQREKNMLGLNQMIHQLKYQVLIKLTSVLSIVAICIVLVGCRYEEYHETLHENMGYNVVYDGKMYYYNFNKEGIDLLSYDLITKEKRYIDSITYEGTGTSGLAKMYVIDKRIYYSKSTSDCSLSEIYSIDADNKIPQYEGKITSRSGRSTMNDNNGELIMNKDFKIFKMDSDIYVLADCKIHHIKDGEIVAENIGSIFIDGAKLYYTKKPEGETETQGIMCYDMITKNSYEVVSSNNMKNIENRTYEFVLVARNILLKNNKIYFIGTDASSIFEYDMIKHCLNKITNLRTYMFREYKDKLYYLNLDKQLCELDLGSNVETQLDGVNRVYAYNIYDDIIYYYKVINKDEMRMEIRTYNMNTGQDELLTEMI